MKSTRGIEGLSDSITFSHQVSNSTNAAPLFLIYTQTHSRLFRRKLTIKYLSTTCPRSRPLIHLVYIIPPTYSLHYPTLTDVQHWHLSLNVNSNSPTLPSPQTHKHCYYPTPTHQQQTMPSSPLLSHLQASPLPRKIPSMQCLRTNPVYLYAGRTKLT